MGGNRHWKKEWKRLALVMLSTLLLVAFLELSSAVLLNRAVDPTRMKRFDDLFLVEPLERNVLPHPFLDWVNQRYLHEQERYLNRLGKDRTDKAYIVAMGGSTTEEGWPEYTEAYLNGRLQEMSASLRVEVFNFGVGGWTSIHSIQNYVFITRYLHPDIVIFHHNINDRVGIREDFFSRGQDSVLQFPRAGQLEKALLRGSRFYKLLRLIYFVSYNPVRYGTGIVDGTGADVPMQSRISSYLNDQNPRRNLPQYFSVRSLQLGTLPEVSREFVLNESYGWLVRAAGSDNAALVMTTMYLNYSKLADKRHALGIRDDQAISDATNDLIRQASRRHNVTLVDLAEEMEPYDPLLRDDGIHWEEEGVRIKGELVGEAVFEILKERYNLSG